MQGINPVGSGNYYTKLFCIYEPLRKTAKLIYLFVKKVFVTIQGFFLAKPSKGIKVPSLVKEKTHPIPKMPEKFDFEKREKASIFREMQDGSYIPEKITEEEQGKWEVKYFEDFKDFMENLHRKNPSTLKDYLGFLEILLRVADQSAQSAIENDSSYETLTLIAIKVLKRCYRLHQAKTILTSFSEKGTPDVKPGFPLDRERLEGFFTWKKSQYERKCKGDAQKDGYEYL